MKTILIFTALLWLLQAQAGQDPAGKSGEGQSKNLYIFPHWTKMPEGPVGKNDEETLPSFVEAKKKAETTADATAEDADRTKKAQRNKGKQHRKTATAHKEKKSGQTLSQAEKKQARQISHSALEDEDSVICVDHFRSKYKRGGVEFRIPCENEDENFCLSFSEFKRNVCKNDNLIRFRCDAEDPLGYTSTLIICEDGCPENKGRCR